MEVRQAPRIKLLPHDCEFYVLAERHARAAKERGMRQCRFKVYWQRLDARGPLQRLVRPLPQSRK